jgi:alpha-L-fucosidase
VKRHVELVTKYNVDMLWFDGYGFPYGDYGKEACTAFLNDNLQKHGSFTALIAGKIADEPAIVKDIESGGSSKILPYPWQGTMTFAEWFHKTDVPSKHNARTVIESFTDMISKNGNLLLNVELLPDGTIQPDHKLILDTVGAWMNRNQEAIYASVPWKIYGDNIGGSRQEKHLTNTDIEAAKAHEDSDDFNERTIASKPYSHQEVRFTQKGKYLYVFVLNPTPGVVEIPSLGLNASYVPNKIKKIELLGRKKEIASKQDEEKLEITIPADFNHPYTQVYKIEGAL